MKKILVLGVGNILQSDDGLGVHIINYINETDIKLPNNVEVFDGGTAGYDLLSTMKGRKKIIIVDALLADDKPGSIYRFPPEHLIQKDSFSLHDVGIKKILDMLRFIGEEPSVEIIGIVPEDIQTLNIGLSASVKKSIPQAVEQILDAVIH